VLQLETDDFEEGTTVTTIPESDMPAPRLELRWEDRSGLERGYTCACVYSLVLRLDEYDIRAERVDDDGESLPKVRELRAELGTTLSDGLAAKRYCPGPDTVDEPFRDGAHAQWDADQLGNPPIYAVAAGRAMLVPRRP
jgi:hypothetical protein